MAIKYIKPEDFHKKISTSRSRNIWFRNENVNGTLIEQRYMLKTGHAEYIGCNSAYIISGNKAPEAFIVTDKNNTEGMIVSKYIPDYHGLQDYTRLNPDHILPEECVIGCELNKAGEIFLTQDLKVKKPGSNFFPPVLDHETIVFIIGFVGHRDLHSANLGFKTEGNNRYAAVIDFDSSIISGDVKLHYAYKGAYRNIYNLYFLYNREKFIQIIEHTLQHKQELINLVDDLGNKDYLDHLINKLLLLEEEFKCFKLAIALRSNDTNLINDLYLSIDPNKIKYVSIQAIQEIADNILDNNHSQLQHLLLNHDYYQHATISAKIKNSFSLDQSYLYNFLNNNISNKNIITILSTAIQYNKQEIFDESIVKVFSHLTASSRLDLFLSAIIFERSVIFDKIFQYELEKSEVGFYKENILVCFITALNYGRYEIFDILLNKVEALKHEYFTEIFFGGYFADYSSRIMLSKYNTHLEFFNKALEFVDQHAFDYIFLPVVNGNKPEYLEVLRPYKDFFLEDLSIVCNSKKSFDHEIQKILPSFCENILGEVQANIEAEL
jgi:hypothetical protein